MKRFYGKEIFTTLEELVDPEHAALVVVDIQNDLVKKKDERGELTYTVPAYEGMVHRVRSTIDEARAAGVSIAYLQHTSLPNFRDESPPRIRYRMKACGCTDPEDLEIPALEQESWGWKVIDELIPEPQDLRILKHRSDGFVATDMDLLLRNSGIKTLIMTGVVTEGCVESTARGGLFHDYYIVVLRDCVGSEDAEAHDDSLRFMSKRFDISTSEEVIALWKGRTS